MSNKVKIIRELDNSLKESNYVLWHGDCINFLEQLDVEARFDLVVTSPPYNLGKEYEDTKLNLGEYVDGQKEVINLIYPRLRESGSICWQVGNYVENGSIRPLDIELASIFFDLGLKLRNRIIWHFGHGLHTKRRFSGRYEVLLWFTKTDNYTFNLDPVRVPSKYPGKKHYKGPKVGQYSGNPKGKNPEDVWYIPNVKSNHVEKTIHPCQFPVGLIEMLVLSMTKEGELVFDPFAGVASAGVAAAVHKRRFWGCDLELEYLETGQRRINETLDGYVKYRAYNKPLYDHRKSNLSKKPENFE